MRNRIKTEIRFPEVIVPESTYEGGKDYDII